MTKIIETFTLASGTYSGGVAEQASSGTLPARAELNPGTKVGYVESVADAGAILHTSFNVRNGLPVDRILGLTVDMGTLPTGYGTGTPATAYPRTNTMTASNTTTADMEYPSNAAHDFGYNDDFTVELWAQPTNMGANRYLVDKHDGTTGWGLKSGTTTNRVAFIIDDGAATVEVEGDFGGTITGAGHQFVVTIAGTTTSNQIDPADITIYMDGTALSMSTVSAGPVTADFSLPSNIIRAGRAGVLAGAFAHLTYVDEFIMYNSVLSAGTIQDLYEKGTDTFAWPRAEWNFTAPGNITLNSIYFPGATGGQFQEEFQEYRKIRFYYAINGGAETEITEAIGDLSVAVTTGQTIDVIAEWRGQDEHLNTTPAWIADQDGAGPTIVYDDGTSDPVTPPPDPTDPVIGIGGKVLGIS